MLYAMCCISECIVDTRLCGDYGSCINNDTGNFTPVLVMMDLRRLGVLVLVL